MRRVLAAMRNISLLFQVLLTVALAPSSQAAPQVQPAFSNASILASCQLTDGGVAVAVANSDSGSAYYLLLPGTQPLKLEDFAGEADLACLSPEEASHLNSTIEGSETISGRILPIGSSSIICGFLSSVEAACWQLDSHGSVRRIGGWVT